MRTDATPFFVREIRRVSPALHGAQRRPPSRAPSTFQTVSLRSSVNKGADRFTKSATHGWSQAEAEIRYLSYENGVSDLLLVFFDHCHMLRPDYANKDFLATNSPPSVGQRQSYT